MAANQDKETLLTTDRFRVNRVERVLPNGSCIDREVIRHAGSVVILPILDDDQVCLIRNFRVAVNQPLIELPAGTLEADESRDACARRELVEETGYSAGRLESLTQFYAAPGILDETMYLFVADQLTPGPPQREPGEEIENYVVGWPQALAMVEDGTIRDAKTIIGLLMYHFRQHTIANGSIEP